MSLSCWRYNNNVTQYPIIASTSVVFLFEKDILPYIDTTLSTIQIIQWTLCHILTLILQIFEHHANVTYRQLCLSSAFILGDELERHCILIMSRTCIIQQSQCWCHTWIRGLGYTNSGFHILFWKAKLDWLYLFYRYKDYDLFGRFQFKQRCVSKHLRHPGRVKVICGSTLRSPESAWPKENIRW